MCKDVMSKVNSL